jgi:glycosyltransferase involved in cell wall biosynthesis
MRRVLVVSYYFPPSPNVAALRMRGLARYLPAHGWEPVFLTAEAPGALPVPDEARAVRVPDPGPVSARLKSLVGFDPGRSFQEQLGVPSAARTGKRPWSRKLFMRVKGLIVFPDEQLLWGRRALPEGRRLIREERFDAILSSSPPPTAHRIARDLQDRSRLPWVADFRDLWTLGHIYEHGRVRRWVESVFEQRTLATADALVTVSSPLAERLETLHRGREVAAIPNGWDARDWAGLEATAPEPRELAIVHAGSLYQGRTDPLPLLRAARKLLDARVLDPATFRIRFYGDSEPWLAGDSAKLGLEGVVEQLGRIPREEVLRREASAQALLLLVWQDPAEPGIYSAKVFEYLGARRPILAIGGPEKSVVRDLLERTGAGDYCPDDPSIERTLERFAREHAASGRLEYRGRASEANELTQDAMARRFAAVLDRAAERRRRG